MSNAHGKSTEDPDLLECLNYLWKEYEYRHTRTLVLRSLFFVQCLLLPILSACASPVAAPTESITCHTAYRSAPNVPIEAEQTISFDASDQQQEAAFADLTFHAQYSSGALDGERALRLWVTRAGETAELHSTLFQLPLESGPQNQFVGGHGFTGLHYAYHPDSGAELQYWCTTGS